MNEKIMDLKQSVLASPNPPGSGGGSSNGGSGMKQEVDDLKNKLNQTLSLIETDINMRNLSMMYQSN